MTAAAPEIRRTEQSKTYKCPACGLEMEFTPKKVRCTECQREVPRNDAYQVKGQWYCSDHGEDAMRRDCRGKPAQPKKIRDSDA
jgi:predicted RNA-binding Zn-ribbon protein involved in translation (DUF1610 family)